MPMTTTAAPTTTANPTTTPTSSGFNGTLTTDIVYLEMNDHEYLVDVYAPAGEGPWPES